jgi:hypothetical protein
MSNSVLQNRDYTLIVAKSNSHLTNMLPGSSDRWTAAQASILALAQKCQEFDPDGITLYLSCEGATEYGCFEKHEQVTADRLVTILEHHRPPGGFDLNPVVQTVLDDYFERKRQGQTKANGATIIVVTDGEPSNRMALIKAIAQATHRMDHNDELGIGFAQVGDDALTRGFLNALDDDLKTMGAKFDIVSAQVLEEIEPHSLTQFLLDAIYD